MDRIPLHYCLHFLSQGIYFSWKLGFLQCWSVTIDVVLLIFFLSEKQQIFLRDLSELGNFDVCISKSCCSLWEMALWNVVVSISTSVESNLQMWICFLAWLPPVWSKICTLDNIFELSVLVYLVNNVYETFYSAPDRNYHNFHMNK